MVFVLLPVYVVFCGIFLLIIIYVTAHITRYAYKIVSNELCQKLLMMINYLKCLEDGVIFREFRNIRTLIHLLCHSIWIAFNNVDDAVNGFIFFVEFFFSSLDQIYACLIFIITITMPAFNRHFYELFGVTYLYMNINIYY